MKASIVAYWTQTAAVFQPCPTPSSEPNRGTPQWRPCSRKPADGEGFDTAPKLRTSKTATTAVMSPQTCERIVLLPKRTEIELRTVPFVVPTSKRSSCHKMMSRCNGHAWAFCLGRLFVSGRGQRTMFSGNLKPKHAHQKIANTKDNKPNQCSFGRLAAVAQDRYALEFASEELQGDERALLVEAA